MIRALLLSTALLLPIAAQAAKPVVTPDTIGGQEILCIPHDALESLLKALKDTGAEIAHYTPEETAAFLRIVNAVEPVTTLTGANMISVAHGPIVVVGFDEPKGRFCRIASDIPRKAFDQIMKKVAEGGV